MFQRTMLQWVILLGSFGKSSAYLKQSKRRIWDIVSLIVVRSTKKYLLQIKYFQIQMEPCKSQVKNTMPSNW